MSGPTPRLVLERIDQQQARSQQLLALQRHVEQVIEDRALLVQEVFAALLARRQPDGERLLETRQVRRQQLPAAGIASSASVSSRRSASRMVSRGSRSLSRASTSRPAVASVNACSNTTAVASRCAFSMLTRSSHG